MTKKDDLSITENVKPQISIDLSPKLDREAHAMDEIRCNSSPYHVWKDKLLLDIGSGPLDSRHIKFNHPNTVHVDIDKKAYHLEVQCDAHHLPFKSESFNLVHASHILEHVNNPYQLVKEICRVTDRYAIIKVPNASHYQLFSESPEHLYGWTSFNLESLLKKHVEYVHVEGAFRITHMTKNKWLRKLETLKTYLIALLFGRNELVAICRKAEKCPSCGGDYLARNVGFRKAHTECTRCGFHEER